jgi:hypothetical protein
VYLQADEVLHEAELPLLRELLVRYRHSRVEAFSLLYYHFFGSYATYKDEPRGWYRRASRIIRTGVGIESAGDAAAFMVRDGDRWRRPRRHDTSAHVYHYGRARPPVQMLQKQRNLERFYHDERWLDEHGIPADLEPIAMYADRRHLRHFTGTHPAVMRALVAAQDWPSPTPAWLGPEWLRRGWVYTAWVVGRGFERLRAVVLRR